MSRRDRAWTIAVYGIAALLLLGAVTQQLANVFPSAIAGHLQRNSEAWLMILLVGPWIQFTRDRLTRSHLQWAVTLGASASLIAVGLGMVLLDVPGSVGTLNEAAFGAAAVIPYTQFRRPLGRWVPWALVASLLAATIAWNRTDLVTRLAESIGLWLLVPLGFDVVDRGILDPTATTSKWLRFAWYAGLVAVPTALAVIERHPLGGLLGEATRYGARLTEGFIAVLVLELFFAVGLGRTGAGAVADPARSATPAT